MLWSCTTVCCVRVWASTPCTPCRPDRETHPPQAHSDCLARIRAMGDLLGRDRVSVNTVAFGPAAEDFAVLQAMSQVLPRGSFQVRAHACVTYVAGHNNDGRTHAGVLCVHMGFKGP